MLGFGGGYGILVSHEHKGGAIPVALTMGLMEHTGRAVGIGIRDVIIFVSIGNKNREGHSIERQEPCRGIIGEHYT